jgi:HEAT repeat protein
MPERLDIHRRDHLGLLRSVHEILATAGLLGPVPSDVHQIATVPSAELPAETLKQLGERILTSGNPLDRLLAVLAFEHYGTAAKAGIPVLRQALKDPDPNVAEQAARILKIVDPSATASDGGGADEV